MKSLENSFRKNMKSSIYTGMALALLFLFASCGSVKKTVYFQDIEKDTVQQVLQQYEVKVHKDDLLSIVVSSSNPELILPFNKPMVTQQLGKTAYGTTSMLGYLVDSHGQIDFPILGELYVDGLTRNQLIELVKSKLIEGGYINDPIVTVQFLNFKVSVMGEVARPGSFSVTGDRITLLEALSMAGDLTIYGKRDRVAVIREENGERKIMYHDLRSARTFESPFYYLQQNDIVYVEPNKRKSQQSEINQNNSVGTWVSIASLLTSMAVLIWK